MKAYITDKDNGKREVEVLCFFYYRHEWWILHQDTSIHVSHYYTGVGLGISSFFSDESLTDILNTCKEYINKPADNILKVAISKEPVINKPLFPDQIILDLESKIHRIEELASDCKEDIGKINEIIGNNNG